MVAKNKDIEQLTEQIKKLNDKKQVFILGVIRGFGVAVGATLVATIVFWTLNKVFTSVYDVPILNDFIDQLNQAIDNG